MGWGSDRDGDWADAWEVSPLWSPFFFSGSPIVIADSEESNRVDHVTVEIAEEF